MDSSITVCAPAKINVHLEIGSRLPSRFHELRSVFQMVDLFDEITVALTSATGECDVTCSDLELPEDNTLLRAYEVFTSASGKAAGCSMHLKKRIPPGAGLGGGSSDAAAVLHGLNEIYGRPLGRSRLQELARHIGSDVPFFLGGSAAACVEGTGEVLSPIEPIPQLYGVIIFPGIHVSTPWAYCELDLTRQRPEFHAYRISREECIRQYVHDAPDRWEFFNSFQPLVAEHWGEYEQIDALFQRWGSDFTLLSGSGGSVVGYFSEFRTAQQCCFAASEQSYWAQCVKMLAKSPFAVYNNP